MANTAGILLVYKFFFYSKLPTNLYMCSNAVDLFPLMKSLAVTNHKTFFLNISKHCAPKHGVLLP